MSPTTEFCPCGSIVALMSAGALTGDHAGAKQVGGDEGAGVGMMNIDTDGDERSAHVDRAL